jgi:ribose 5-phosphate isomerase B
VEAVGEIAANLARELGDPRLDLPGAQQRVDRPKFTHMKKFAIITEADARVLTPGETVMLERRGHITPLAQDTLKERRITVVRDGLTSPDEDALAPVADIRRVALASDHGGIALRKMLATFLRGRGLAVDDIGTHTTDPVDYPDVAASVARKVASREADAGIVIDGAGIGSAIAANKIPGVRAVMATSETIARYSREHNGANVLTLGATLVTEDEARAIVTTWLTTPMREARYIRRLAKIRDLEIKN